MIESKSKDVVPNLVEVSFDIDQSLYDQISAISRANGVTPEFYALCFFHWLAEASDEAVESISEGTVDVDRVLSFKSSLTMEEIEANFKGVNLGDELIEGLTEILKSEK